MRRGNAFGRACLCVSVCSPGTLTFESHDVETPFCYSSTSYLGRVRISRSSGQVQGHNIKKSYAHSWVVRLRLKEILVLSKFKVVLHFLRNFSTVYCSE